MGILGDLGWSFLGGEKFVGCLIGLMVLLMLLLLVVMMMMMMMVEFLDG